MSEDKQKVIITDLDDTLVRFTSSVIDVSNVENGTNLQPIKLEGWGYPPAMNEVFIKYESWFYAASPILNKVRQKMLDMKAAGYQIFIMTARPESFKMQTYFNLLLNKLIKGEHYDEIFFCKNKALKINRLSEKYDIRIFVDDRAKTVNEVKQRTKVSDVYLIDMNSNQNAEMAEGVIRIKSIDEIEV